MKRIPGIWGAALGMALAAMASANDGEKKAPDGKPVFVKYKCGSCHSIASQKIEKKADPAEAADAKPGARKPPDLSSVGLDRKADWIRAYLSKEAAIDGRKHIKKFRGTADELATLAAWLETMKAEKPKEKSEEKAKEPETSGS